MYDYSILLIKFYLLLRWNGKGILSTTEEEKSEEQDTSKYTLKVSTISLFPLASLQRYAKSKQSENLLSKYLITD